MTNDDFLRGLRADWRRQTIDVSGLAARVEAPSRQASGKLSSLAVLRELEAAGAFAYPPLPPPSVTVDTGAVAPAEAAARIRAALAI